jgi:hypothetical protein
MTVKIPTLLSLFLAAAVPAGAAEIDSLTGRQRELRDATGALDSRVNGYLRRAVERANARGRGCNEELLYFEIRRAVASPFVGHVLAEELGDAEGLDRSHVALDESIYRDLGMFDAISVHLKNLSAVVEMDGNRIGLDKFGHFFAQGWKYFDRAYRNGSEGGDESGGGDEHGIEAALAWGERTERTYYGFYTTGIYSHADLAANFDGMRFWLRVLGHGDDPLGGGWWAGRPYIQCARKFWSREPYWRVKRVVRMEHYVNAAWDEAVNCSHYRNPTLASLVEARVAELEVQEGSPYTCPITPDACARAREHYGPFAERLLHPRCLAAEPERRRRWWFW